MSNHQTQELVPLRISSDGNTWCEIDAAKWSKTFLRGLRKGSPG
jgi:hypothetical protein